VRMIGFYVDRKASARIQLLFSILRYIVYNFSSSYICVVKLLCMSVVLFCESL